MRIALLIYGSLDSLSGGYLYDRKLVQALKNHGDQVEIVSLPWRSYPRHLGDNLSAGLFHRLERLPVDLLLQDELNHPSLFYLNQRLKGRVSYPIISIVHHLISSETRPGWQNRIYRAIETRYLSGVDGFIFNSRTTQGVVEELVGKQRPSIVAHPAGDRLNPQIQEQEIACRAQEPGPLRLFFLGNLIPRKGLHTLLEALSLLPRELWQLSIAGSPDLDPRYAGRVRSQVRDGGLGDQVVFLGPLGEAELVTQMISSHVLVLPSAYEGYGIAYLEGMGFGLPAIATTAGAAREIITHGEDGFLIPPGDAPALAEHLHALAQDRARLLRMSLAARKRFSAHPTWEQTTERIRRFLKTCVLSQS